MVEVPNMHGSPNILQVSAPLDPSSKKDQIFMMNFDFMKNYTKYFNHNNPDGVIFIMSLRMRKNSTQKRTFNFGGGATLKLFNLSALKMALQQQSPLLDGFTSPKKGGGGGGGGAFSNASKILESPARLLKRAFTKKNFFQSD